MDDLLLVRRLSPWMSDVGKRLVRSPKIYVRDCGLVHALLNIGTLDMLFGHPIGGATWEGLVIENLLTHLPFGADAGFYRTSGGAEVDLVLSLPPQDLWTIEIKKSMAPKPERGFYLTCEDLQPSARFVVYPGLERFSLAPNTMAISLPDIVNELRRATAQPAC